MPGHAPRIGRGVLLSAGATLLGDISIGDFARIGAGALVRLTCRTAAPRSACRRG